MNEFNMLENKDNYNKPYVIKRAICLLTPKIIYYKFVQCGFTMNANYQLCF